MKEGDDPLADIPELIFENVSADLHERRISIGKAALRSASIFLRRKKNGSEAFYELMGPASEHTQSETGDSSSKWKVSAAEIRTEGCSILHEDQSLLRPAVIETSAVNCILNNLALGNTVQPDSRLTLRGEASVKTGGRIKISGTSDLSRSEGTLEFEIEELSLSAFGGYLEDYLRASVAGGTLEATGSLDIDRAREVPAKLSAKIQVSDFLARETDPAQDLLSWKHLALSDTSYDSPSMLSIGEVVITEPHAFIERRPDGALNVLTVLIKRGAGESATSAPGPGLKFNLGKLKIDEGLIKFVDRTVSPPAELELKNLKAEAGVLSNTEERLVPAKITGRVVPDASLLGTADLNLKQKGYFDRLHFELQNLYFPALSPYVGRYAGRQVQEGGLSLKMDYSTKGGELSGVNSLAISGLRFGGAVKSPEAVSLPLDLAAALLKDQSGVVHLDFPIRGNFAQPDFRIGALLLRAVTNAITGVVSSPFSLLASIAGTSRSLDRCYFEYGSAELDAEEQLRLDDLGKALKERPGITLSVAPLFDPVNDRRAMAKERLRREISADENGEPGSDRDYGYALLKHYRKEFGKAAEPSTNQLSAPTEEVRRFEKVESPERARLIAQVQELLLQNTSVSEADLKEIAVKRGRQIHNWLEQKSSLGRRVSVLEPSAQKFGEARLFVALTIRTETE